ncbi:MAG: DNA-directed RNA polymerase subunit beta' [Candidatus Coatesbacteria bacterium 4484_99]|uniref:DNA-directed RNA polymerase subunit beta' n=1 Tax=Candidatus Coatesbacteria bacterium 4484_99 TaxID=1970774 RepID=A0A1W9S1V8_9BACT|nr:MAG: DNA-directed RNA polymerase subunit beta' [Candidatus Coatesbacteria bacterium 4484_99]
MKNRGIICDRCGVEVTESRVRRERMGHIKLVSPCAHIWFVKSIPNRIALLLGISGRELERVIYYASYIVLDPGDPEVTGLKKLQLLTPDQYNILGEKTNWAFKAEMGAEAIKKLLSELDLAELSRDLRKKFEETKSKQTKRNILRRLREVNNFLKSNNKPEWMILVNLPVLPPDLRPLVPLDGGRFATSDLNDLYRTVINRNNRLRKLIEIRAPEVILKNEKRMLQEAVDALIDNGKRGFTIRGASNRPLKSLTDSLKGKQGRFRQNLLGKRVDYSGRAVIVVGPELKIHQCGIPKRMALELFKPFVIQRLEQKGFVHTIRSARKLLDQARPEVWDVLDEVIRDHPVLLNRAPTLHRLGVQAFLPVLVEGDAIQVHPLVCAAFNADFDGDTMSVHVPISVESQLEALILMLSSRNILSPAHGGPLAVPSRDMVLGLYALTKEKSGEEGEGMLFSDMDDAISAYQQGIVGRNAKIRLRYGSEIIDTTIGRILFNELLPEELRFINELIDKDKITELVALSYKNLGNAKTVEMLDKLKDAGFLYSTIYGISMCVDDILIPPEKDKILADAQDEVKKVWRDYKKQIITEGERYNKIVDIWTQNTDLLGDLMYKNMKEDREGFNPIYMMAQSGARASKTQIRQLAALRGLMSKPQKRLTGEVGEIIENPITSNFREGLSVLEYFISTHGGRKGLADTALKTADAGYLTRRLIDVAHDVIVVEEDCGTLMGIDITALKSGEETIEPLSDRILGRVCLEDVYNPITGEIIANANTLIDEELSEKIENAGVQSVRIRSILTCESKRGVCANCYGRNLATGRKVEVGETVGVIAAQSIGEPGTQLTLRTFHIGGTASRIIEQSKITSGGDRVVKYHQLKTIKRDGETTVVVSRTGEVSLNDEKGRERVRYIVPYGASMLVSDGSKVKKGDIIFEWDPYSEPILSDISGKVHYIDIVEGATMREEIDTSGMRQRMITDYRDKKLHPRIIIEPEDGDNESTFSVPSGSYLIVRDGESVKAGDILVKIPRGIGKTRDITGGLPRVQDLFEARKPKDPAIVTEIDGRVEFKGITKNKWSIVVHGDVEEREYLIPLGKHLKVQNGDYIHAGQQLCEGMINPHDVLKIKGDKEVQKYLVNEIQEVYRLQGVKINDKHFEVIVSKMLRRVKIDDPGDSEFLPDEEVDKFTFKEVNESLIKQKKKPATAHPILQGITKASLSTDSFISAASFQETTRVLTEAAVAGKRDFLQGLKENVIIGHLIPAGTGTIDREPYLKAVSREIGEVIEQKRIERAEREEIEKEEKIETGA